MEQKKAVRSNSFLQIYIYIYINEGKRSSLGANVCVVREGGKISWGGGGGMKITVPLPGFEPASPGSTADCQLLVGFTRNDNRYLAFGCTL
jgi:hypothetical protein